MTPLVTLTHRDATLHLAPVTGGAIASFTWRDIPVLRPTPPDMVDARDVRRHACYPLVPYSNRIEHGRLAFRGRTHELALNFGDHPHSIHGVGWQRPWRVVSASQTTALLAYEHAPGPDAADADRRAWPWPFTTTQWFQLSDDSRTGGIALRMRLTLINSGAEAFPFGLGWHPFFPCTPETLLEFHARGVWETDDTMIPTRQVPADHAFGFAAPRPIGSAVLDNVYTGWTGEAHVTHADIRRITTMRGDSAAPFFVCYIPPHHTFMAIEPVTQMTDAFNRAERGDRDTGARVLAPAESFSCTMEIVTHDAR